MKYNCRSVLHVRDRVSAYFRRVLRYNYKQTEENDCVQPFYIRNSGDRERPCATDCRENGFVVYLRLQRAECYSNFQFCFFFERNIVACLVGF